MYQQQQPQPQDYSNYNNAQSTDYNSTKTRSKKSLRVSLCLDITLTVFIFIVLGCLGLGLKDVKGDQRSRIIHEIQLDNMIEYDRDAKEAKSIHKTAKLIEYVGMIPVGISAILAIIACICDCVLLSQTSQSRGVTHTDIWCLVAAGVTLLIGSILEIAGASYHCNDKFLSGARSPFYSYQDSISDRIRKPTCSRSYYSTWKIAFAVVGLVISLVLVVPIVIAVKGLRNSKQEEVPNAAQNSEQVTQVAQVQQGPYDPYQGGAYPTAPPPVSPSYVQQQQMYQQQAPPGGANAPYYADPNAPPSYQTYY